MKTVYSSEDLKIKWHRVSEIYSYRHFIFTFSNGKNVKGTIKMNQNDNTKVIISEEGRSIEGSLVDIIHIKAIEGNFRGSFDAEIDFGY